jgi:hypothetical protein
VDEAISARRGFPISKLALTKSFPKVKIKVAFDWQSLPIEDVVGDLEGKSI